LGYKLVDEIGSLDLAVKDAAELAGLKEEPKPYYPEKKDGDFPEIPGRGLADRLFDRALAMMEGRFVALYR
jgi:ClpP class serine protease